MRTLAHHVVVLAAILTAACGRAPEPAAQDIPAAVRDVPAPADLDAVLAECEAATGLPLRSRVTTFRFVDRAFPCGNKSCFGLTEWLPGAAGTVVTVAMVHIITGEATQDVRQTALIHEVAGHVAYGWPNHEKPSMAASMVESIYAGEF